MKKPVRARATDDNALPIPVAAGDCPERVLAEIVASGVASNAYTVKTFGAGTFGPLSLRECIAALNASAGRVDAGDLTHAEAMLMAQAAALNAIFGEMARRAAMNMGEHLDATERYMRLALKAQGQCRGTLETLATIKNPPVVFARQANIAHGPQQVNNGAQPLADAAPGGGGVETSKPSPLGTAQFLTQGIFLPVEPNQTAPVTRARAARP